MPRSSLLAGSFWMMVFAFLPARYGSAADEQPRPNILWITCEDISPNLRCYGDDYAVTPHLDRLAAEGVRYTQAFAPIGVCAPARSCLITGMYPPSLGTQHMRCRGTLPKEVKCFPQYLREAGYFCTNHTKTDYNFAHDPATWDQNGKDAHWRNRRPGQPFFSVINFTSCHESQIRLPEKQYQQRTADFSAEERHDPDRATVPPFHPDTPAVRKDWARYADMITYMDREVGSLLQQLADDGLAENTIVVFFSDHGAGMPRCKRWLYDSSLRVPMIVRFPAAYADWSSGEAGTTTDRLVSFVDFAPTVLSLAGVEVPAHMQGQAFLGPQASPPRQYIYGYRDRMDERYDLLRCVRDRRYKYIRNYLPHLPWFQHQHISYMYEMPTMQDWQRLADAGELTGPPATFMAMSKPVEELYDTQSDPYEVHNLTDDPAQRETLERLRTAHRQWMLEIVDLGLLPEAMLRTRFDEAPYTAVRELPPIYPIQKIADAADAAGFGKVNQLLELLDDEEPAVRYWAATGLGDATKRHVDVLAALRRTLNDDDPSVRVAAADALCRHDRLTHALPTLKAALSDPNEWVRLAAINVLDRLDERAGPPGILHFFLTDDQNEYIARVANHIISPDRRPEN